MTRLHRWVKHSGVVIGALMATWVLTAGSGYVYVGVQLRRKLGADRIRNVRGLGWMVERAHPSPTVGGGR